MTDENDLERAKLNTETATIPWRELQRHFAAGRVVWVADTLDLVEVATLVMRDNKAAVQPWIEQQWLRAVTDAEAAQWYENDASLWAVVVSPWVLVQQKK